MKAIPEDENLIHISDPCLDPPFRGLLWPRFGCLWVLFGLWAAAGSDSTSRDGAQSLISISRRPKIDHEHRGQPTWVGGSLAATQPTQKFPNFGVQTGTSLRGTHHLWWGASPPTSIDGLPGRRRPLGAQTRVRRKTLCMGWVAGRGPLLGASGRRDVHQHSPRKDRATRWSWPLGGFGV